MGSSCFAFLPLALAGPHSKTPLNMNDTPETPLNDGGLTEEQRLILDGLAQLKHRNALKKLTIAYGPRGNKKRVRQQLFLTPQEDEGWKAVVAICSGAAGRRVAKALVVRLALTHLLTHAARSLTDPVAREKLRADLLNVRNERVAEYADR